MKSFAALALAASVVALPAEPQGYTMSVPITYNASAKPNLQAAISRLNAKYRSASAKADDDGTGTVITTPTNENDRAYITEVQIGTPAQKLKLDFDTGSSDLWVYSNDTEAGIAGDNTLYLPGKSSTATKVDGETWSIGYADGSGTSGVVYHDVVTIGGLSVQNQGVESAIKASSGFSGSGLLGLAYDTGNTATPQQEKTWFSNVKASLKAPLFTVRLRHQADGSYNFGYIDESQYTGDILYTPAFGDKLGHRLFKMDGYAIGDGSMVKYAYNATPDTGSSLFLVPNTIAKEYWANVANSSSTEESSGTLVFTYPCSETKNLPDFTVGISGKQITVPGHLATYATLDNGICEGGIAGGDKITPDFAIFGDVFLKAIFTIFDDGNDQIGFAVGK